MDMAAKTIKMDQLKLILRLHHNGYSKKQIARQTGISHNAVKKYLANQIAVETDNLSLPKLHAIGFYDDSINFISNRYERLIEHFRQVEGSLKQTGVTRQLLWQEYRYIDEQGYNYSQYCYLFNEYLRHNEVVMHLENKAAETKMIDFARKKLSYIDRDTGELIQCQFFISVLPYNGLIFCKAVHIQGTFDFIDSMHKF